MGADCRTESVGDYGMSDRDKILRFLAKWQSVCENYETCQLCRIRGRCTSGIFPEKLKIEKRGELVDAVLEEYQRQNGGREE